MRADAGLTGTSWSICDRCGVDLDRPPTPIDWREPAAVAVGSAIGAGGRWAVARGLDVGAAASGAFPWHTLGVNVLGCLVIGIAAIRVATRVASGFVVTGLLGGFTTMSAVAVEANDLADADRLDLAALYVLASVVAGVAATWVATTFTERATASEGSASPS
ncbi:MAG: CrcB family protein [Actinomycetota bacterium]